MARPRGVLLFLAVGAACLVGCELVVGIHDKNLSTDLADGAVPLVDGAPTPVDGEPPPLDGAVPPREDAPPPPVDTGVDTGVGPSDAGLSDPCKGSTFIFCDDFDTLSETTLGNAPWSFAYNTGTGSGEAFDTMDYSSAPRSVQFQGPTGGQAQLGVNLGNTLSTSFRFQFDVRFDAYDLGVEGQIGVSQLSAAGGEYNYAISTDGNGAPISILQIYGGSGDGTLLNTLSLPAPSLTTWTRVAVSYHVGTAVTLEVGGASTTDTMHASQAPGVVANLIVGDVYINAPAGAMKLEIDNVILQGQ